MKKSYLLSSLCVLSLIFSVTSYASDFTVDQQSDDLPGNGSTGFNNTIGQSFSPTFNFMDHVELKVNSQNPPTTVRVVIRATPTGSILGSSNPIIMTDTVIELRHFEFAPIDISAYNELFIQVERVEGLAFGLFYAGDDTVDSYTGGKAYRDGFMSSLDFWFRTGLGSVPPAPEITVTDSVAPELDLQVPFGSVTEMTTSDKMVTVTNDGGQDLLIGPVAISNPLAAPFSIVSETCSNQSVAPAANCSMTVRFAPLTTGAANDSFDIPSNDADENPVTIDVSGMGISAAAPEITVTDSVAPETDLLVPFGEITEMTESVQTVTVTNDGTANLHISSISALATPFSLTTDSCSGMSVALGADCSLTVRFSPLSIGGFEDSFDIFSNDDDENPVTVNVSGTGLAILPLDSNGDGISDADAIAIGLNPLVLDTDGDGFSDVEEVGDDVSDPTDTDGDGIIDALEPGDAANDARIVSELPLESGDSVTIVTAAGEMLLDVSTDPVITGPNGISFPFGMVNYTTTVVPGGFVTVRLTFSANLPNPLELHKVEAAVFTLLPTVNTDPDGYWTQIDAKTVDITLKDGGDYDLDDTENGFVVDPIAPGSGEDGGQGGVCDGLDPVTNLFPICLQAHSAKKRLMLLQSKNKASPRAIDRAQSALDDAIAKFAELGGGSIPGL